MMRVLFFFLTAAIAAVLGVGSAQAQLAHRYSFDDLTDSVGDADGTQMGDVFLAGGSALVNQLDVARNGRIDLLSSGANGININTYSATTIEFWATPECDGGAACSLAGVNANDNFSTAVSFGSVYNNTPALPDAGNGAGADYIIMQTHRGGSASRGAISVNNETTPGAPWGAETGVDGPEHNDGGEHHYALVIDSTSLSFYVDGVEQGTTALANPNSHGLANMLSGVSNDHVWIGTGYLIDQSWSGSMNELRIYNQAAASEYIAASYTAGADSLTQFIEKVVIPEPTTLCLALIGLCGFAARRRKS
jgi:hypothetical protein